MSKPPSLPFDQPLPAVASRRSSYGYLSKLALDRAAPGEAWTSLAYRPVFVGDTETGVIHGGVVTAMLDETCGMAVQLALDGTGAIATLDLRIDYPKPATPGPVIPAPAVRYRATPPSTRGRRRNRSPPRPPASWSAPTAATCWNGRPNRRGCRRWKRPAMQPA